MANPVRFTTCRSCGRRIFFAHTSSGRPMPFDAESPKPGHWRLTGATHGGNGTPLIVYDAACDDGYVTHFASCPDADEWRGQQLTLAPDPARR